jgi:hypothetical protein
LKTQKLILEYDYDFVLIGIVAAVREFKLAWHLNKMLQLDLRKVSDLQYDFLKDCNFFISNFIFETEYSSFRLLKNRSVEFINVKKPYLLPELKQYDYFVIMSGEYAAYYGEMVNKLRDIPVIELANTLDTELLPSKENLLIY